MAARAGDQYRPRGVWRKIAIDRAGSVLLGILFLTIVVLQFGSMFVRRRSAAAGRRRDSDSSAAEPRGRTCGVTTIARLGGNMSEQPTASPGLDLSLTNTQLSWMRSDLSNVRTLLAWARTSVSMIGFGFTIFNFYRGFLESLAGSGRQDAARNLGMALVAAGTLAMIVAVWNYWVINKSLLELADLIHVAKSFERRWVYSYLLSAILILIGFVTFVFMLRVA